MGLAIALLTPASAQAACGIGQRIELTKAGYDKAEVERLCSEAATPAPATPPQSMADPLAVLRSATYDVGTKGEAKVMFPADKLREFDEVLGALRALGIPVTG